MTINDPEILLVLCLLGTFLLRAAGVFAAGQVDDDSALFRWIGCVAFAIAAGLMAKIILLPSGMLADSSLTARLVGIGAGVTVFFLTGRRVFVGLGVGVLAFAAADLA